MNTQYSKTAFRLFQVIKKSLANSKNGVTLADGERYVYSTYYALGKKLGKSEATIKRAVAELKKGGEIVVCHPNGVSGGNYYRVVLRVISEKNFIGCDLNDDPKSLYIGKQEQILLQKTTDQGADDRFEKTEKEEEVQTEHVAAGQGTATQMLEIWNQTAGKSAGKVWGMTRDRARYLISMMRFKLFGDMDKWRELCEKVASNDFLVRGAKKIRCLLDWFLDFDNYTKFLEGSYDDKPREGQGADYCAPVPPVTEAEVVQASQSETEQAWRTGCLKHPAIGSDLYRSWLADLEQMPDETSQNGGILVLKAKTGFIKDRIDRDYAHRILALAKQVNPKLCAVKVIFEDASQTVAVTPAQPKTAETETRLSREETAKMLAEAIGLIASQTSKPVQKPRAMPSVDIRARQEANEALARFREEMARLQALRETGQNPDQQIAA